MIHLKWFQRFLCAWGLIVSVSLIINGESKASDSVSIRSDQILLLEFMSTDCPACQIVSPLLKEFKEKKYPIQEINEKSNGSDLLFKQYSIKSMPTFVMLFNGQEVDRFVSQGESAAILKPQLIRMFNQTLAKRDQALKSAKSETERQSVSQLEKKQDQNSVTPFIRGQMPATSSALETQSFNNNESLNTNKKINQSSGNQNNDQYFKSKENSITNADLSLKNSNYSLSQATGHPMSSPLTSSVRIRVQSLNTTEKGTGTIIHTTQTGQNLEGLVLTCGHLFRETQGKGKIEVDVFDPNSNQSTTVEGVCVFYDDEIDVGFVGIPLPFNVQPVPLVPIEYWAKIGDRATSVGCNNGEKPSAWEHQILSTTQSFFQPKDPNSGKKSFNYIQVSNAPIQGRSGGGLFLASDSDYYLLGVCNAGDPTDNNGYFLPTSVIYETLLATPHLKKVYNDLVMQSSQNSLNVAQSMNNDSKNELLQTSIANNPSMNAETTPNIAAVSARFDKELPNPNSLSNESIRPVNYEDISSASQMQMNSSQPNISQKDLNNESVLDAGLQELRKRQQEGAEIICVIHWPASNENNPTPLRESEVIRLPKR